MDALILTSIRLVGQTINAFLTIGGSPENGVCSIMVRTKIEGNK